MSWFILSNARESNFLFHSFLSFHGLVLISKFHYYRHVVTNVIYQNIRSVIAVGSGTSHDVIYQAGCLVCDSGGFGDTWYQGFP